MDVYEGGGIGVSVDDLLDLPTDEGADFLSHHHPVVDSSFLPSSSSSAAHFPQLPLPFNDILCVPAEDAAELEWLSNYMADDNNDYPPNSLTAAAATFNKHTQNNTDIRRAGSDAAARRCTHCASEKTPQWRTGPLGPKTLCNACGVRYKSGRLVPEYRPAASPTFVLTQHSNSHRKVLELRRQKEMQQQQEAAYARHFRVC